MLRTSILNAPCTLKQNCDEYLSQKNQHFHDVILLTTIIRYIELHNKIYN